MVILCGFHLEWPLALDVSDMSYTEYCSFEDWQFCFHLSNLLTSVSHNEFTSIKRKHVVDYLYPLETQLWIHFQSKVTQQRR